MTLTYPADRGRVARTTSRRLTSPVLVGRERELRLLLGAATLPPALAIVEGEAGVGKTRLVRELVAAPELRGRRVYLGGAEQLSEPFLLGPVVDALREARPAAPGLTPAVGALRPLLPELSRILPALPEPLGDPRAERHRVFRALRELLAALGPAVLVLEDLHWADDATVDLLRFLVARMPPELALVCTYRQPELADSSPLRRLPSRLPGGVTATQIELEALDRSQVRTLAGSILEREAVSDELAGYLYDGSGGVPFAVEELVRLVEDRSDAVRRRGVWVRRDLDRLGVPRALRDSILERLERLGAGARAVVRAAAVLGLPADRRLLAKVSGVRPDRVGRALTEALSAALLLEVGDARYGFRHVLARQAIEEAIPGPLRHEFHLRAASALRTVRPQPVARLAHHYRGAGRARDWIRFAEAAADRASSLEDDAAAYRFLKDAVAVPGLPPRTRARLGIKLAEHARQCLAHEEAIEPLRRLLDDERLTRGDRGELRMGLVRLLSRAGDASAARLETIRAVEELSGRPALAAEAMVYVSLLAFLWGWGPDGDLEEPVEWLDRAVRTAARSKDRAAMISAAGHRADYLLAVGDPRGWQAVERIPAPRGDRETEQARRVYGNLADAALHPGHYHRVEAFIEQSRRLAAATGRPRESFALRSTELQLRWLLGDWAGLEEDARSHLETWGDSPVLRSVIQAVIALLLLARGEVQSAHLLLRSVADDFRGERPVLGWVSAGLAEVRLAEGANDGAVEEAARALGPIERMGVWAWATDVAPVSVEALLAAGRRAEASDLTRRFADGLQGRDAPAARAALALCRALLAEADGDRATAARGYLETAGRWLALPRPYQAARARERAGRCLLIDHGDEAELVEAMDAFRALGAAWDVARVRRTLREHGAIPPHRRGRKGYGRELTPRELEVARLARDGLSNREIGLALFLAKKTVEGHLRSTMRKLGVSSRAELAERLPGE